jgi:hypothetical protein
MRSSEREKRRERWIQIMICKIKIKAINVEAMLGANK